MAEKLFTNVRLGLKVDTLENWQASTLPLKKGEVAFATVAASAGNGLKEPVVMMKIGEDGVKTFSDIEWNFYAKASDVLTACKSEDALKTFVNGVIADAGIATSEAMESLAGRVTTAEGEIDALQAELDTAETGLKARMTTAEGAIDALETLVGDTAVATQISNAIAELKLSETYEAKGEAAKVSTALETYKTTNDAAVLANTNNITANTNAINAIKDGTTIDSFADVESALAGKETAGAAATAEANAKAYADGLADNYDAKGAAATAESNAKAYAKEYADGLAGNYDAAGSAAAAEAAAKKHADDELARLVGTETVSAQISTAITNQDLANKYDAKGAAAAVEGKLNTHISEAAAAYETKTDAAAKLTEAKDYTDDEVAKVQGEVDALETYVGTIPESATAETIVAYIDEKAAATLESAGQGSSNVLGQLNQYKTDNDARVEAVEGAVDAIEADYLKGADKTELQNAIDALELLVGDDPVADQITAVTDPLAARVKAVEDDYLKAADKTELEGKIKSNADAIELLTNGVDSETVDGVNDLIQYVKDHGTEVTGIKADIKANADAIDAIEADYLKAADKTELSGLIGGLDTRMGAAETAIGTKAAQSDLEALAGRITTVENDLNTETTGLKARVGAAESAIDALETKVGDKKVSEQITDVTNPLAERVVALEAIDHEHANKAVLDGIEAADVTAWDAKVDDVTAAADSGLKATRTGNTVAIEINESVTWIFDCGDSGVTAE